MLFIFVCCKQLDVSSLFSVIISLFFFIIIAYYDIKELIYVDLELTNIR